tara:strand:- start:2129 stop:2575 length:447 start_codon:yes stop_codon:yes gene_type:complete
MTAHVRNFFAPGIPKPQPRPRAVAIGGVVRMYTPSNVKGWRQSVKIAVFNEGVKPLQPLAGSISVNLGFIFERPKSHFRSGKYSHLMKPDAPKAHTKKPDCDNLAKAVLDVLTELKFWNDDSQVTHLTTTKQYGDKSGCQISIAEINQ